MADVQFHAGGNIAMKVPLDRFEDCVYFYAEVLGLPVAKATDTSVAIEFGPMLLWIDCVETLEKPEVWLEVTTPDTVGAAEHLAAEGVERADEVEALPEDLDGFWIRNPAGLVHLVDFAPPPEEEPPAEAPAEAGWETVSDPWAETVDPWAQEAEAEAGATDWQNVADPWAAEAEAEAPDEPPEER
ncbi:MAG: hypothetical protein ACPGOV_00015 [Magnetovibrionaceae bacterium]